MTILEDNSNTMKKNNYRKQNFKLKCRIRNKTKSAFTETVFIQYYSAFPMMVKPNKPGK